MKTSQEIISCSKIFTVNFFVSDLFDSLVLFFCTRIIANIFYGICLCNNLIIFFYIALNFVLLIKF